MGLCPEEHRRLAARESPTENVVEGIDTRRHGREIELGVGGVHVAVVGDPVDVAVEAGPVNDVAQVGFTVIVAVRFGPGIGSHKEVEVVDVDVAVMVDVEEPALTQPIHRPRPGHASGEQHEVIKVNVEVQVGIPKANPAHETRPVGGELSVRFPPPGDLTVLIDVGARVVDDVLDVDVVADPQELTVAVEKELVRRIRRFELVRDVPPVVEIRDTRIGFQKELR